jgi:hypothetical protein
MMEYGRLARALESEAEDDDNFYARELDAASNAMRYLKHEDSIFDWSSEWQ